MFHGCKLIPRSGKNIAIKFDIWTKNWWAGGWGGRANSLLMACTSGYACKNKSARSKS
jgi:hypothetical protein